MHARAHPKCRHFIIPPNSKTTVRGPKGTAAGMRQAETQGEIFRLSLMNSWAIPTENLATSDK